MKDLNIFFLELIEQIDGDSRLHPLHIALLLALLYYKGDSPPTEFFNASRKKLMLVSHIRNIVSYHKYLSQLVQYGYVEYIPSWHPKKGSQFRFIFWRKERKDSQA
jgi:hypothetical protein